MLTLELLDNLLKPKPVRSAPYSASHHHCTDVARPPRTDDTCNLQGGNALICVAGDETVIHGPGAYDQNAFWIAVTLTDQAGNTHTKTHQLVDNMATA